MEERKTDFTRRQTVLAGAGLLAGLAVTGGLGTGTGNGQTDDPPEDPTFDGRPRSAYDYCGTQTELHAAWAAGEITTAQFQEQTAWRDGTAMLSTQGCPPPAEQVEFILLSASTAGVNYRVHLDTEPRRVADGSDMRAESSDEILQRSDGTWEIRGSTGSATGDQAFGDTFRWEHGGRTFGVLGFTADASEAAYQIRVNGTPVNPGFFGEYEPAPNDPNPDPDPDPVEGIALGGGNGYPRIVDQSQADFLASSWSALESALNSANAGQIVYVTDDMTERGSLTIPDGVIVAGDRGLNGSSGPRIDSGGGTVFYLGDDSRLTGVEIRGPSWDSDFTSSGGGNGVEMNRPGAELDNCEIHGFGYSCVRSEHQNHIHHNYLHDTNTDGLGYGVVVHDSSGNPTIEYNYFYDNRHSVAAGGENYGYVCRFNHFGPREWKHVIDIHDPGATETYIQNNIVEPERKEAGGTGVSVGGWHVGSSSHDLVLIEGNWFFRSASNAMTDDVRDLSTVRNNHYGPNADVTPQDIIPGHPGFGHAPWN